MAGSEYGVTLPRHGAPFLRRCIARHLICAEGARPDRSYGEGNIIDEPPVDKIDSIGNGSLRKSACVLSKMFHGGERARSSNSPGARDLAWNDHRSPRIGLSTAQTLSERVAVFYARSTARRGVESVDFLGYLPEHPRPVRCL